MPYEMEQIDRCSNEREEPSQHEETKIRQNREELLATQHLDIVLAYCIVDELEHDWRRQYKLPNLLQLCDAFVDFSCSLRPVSRAVPATPDCLICFWYFRLWLFLIQECLIRGT